MLRELILRIPQPVRFVIAGGTVFVVSTASTILLTFLGVHIQAAIPIGFCVGLVLQFNLQRRFVFANHDEFHLRVPEQLVRYLPTAAIQYFAIAGLTAVLPDALGINERIVYVSLVFIGALITFTFTRAFVFHGNRAQQAGAARAADEPAPEHLP